GGANFIGELTVGDDRWLSPVRGAFQGYTRQPRLHPDRTGCQLGWPHTNTPLQHPLNWYLKVWGSWCRGAPAKAPPGRATDLAGGVGLARGGSVRRCAARG